MINKKAYDGRQMKAFRSLYGKNYVESGWLGDMYYCKDETRHFLKATVSPSQPGVGRTDYNVWVAVSDSAIDTGYCTCPAGSGRSCSHIAAVVYAVIMAWDHGLAGETCTDKPQLWGKGSAQVLTSHQQFADIIAENLNTKEVDDTVARPKQYLDHDDLKTFVKNSAFKPLWECKGTMLTKILNAPETTISDKQPLVHGLHDVDTDKPAVPSCSSCKVFFNKYVEIGYANINVLEKATVRQSSVMWTDSRKVRLTASKINSIPKTSRADPDKFVTNHIYDRFKGCAATKHGQKFEPIARKWFEHSSRQTVRESGIVVREGEEYLAASPDGVIDQNTIIEIKCPTKSLEGLVSSGKYDVCYDKDHIPFLNPKGKNGYYTQVQMAMYCTKTSLCKFILWTAEKQMVLDVLFDSDFVDKILPRVRAFYFKHLLPRLTDEMHFNRLKLSPEYKKVCK
ncbi:uncharacterized protein LOC128553029 isoform X2 [Mercenaria mercenaria]|nr:uncharacterized protein LOC128553029 isoform X2 [Mercenaria mercenaria]